MSRIDTLIAKHCPHGVEYRELGKAVKTITTGKLNANAMVENGIYPFFTCNANPFKIDTYAFNTEAIIISGNGSQVGHINYYKGKFNAYQRTYIVSNCDKDLLIHYLLFYLKARLRSYIIQNSRKGSVPYITMPMITKFSIPVPPLEVQKEIVNVLDKFTELEAELEAELKARNQQYNHYRNTLLRSKNKKTKPLNSIALYSDTRIETSNLNSDNHVGVDNLLQNRSGKTASNYVPKIGRLTRYEKNDILIGNIRPYLKKIWYSDRQGGTNGDVLVVRIKEEERENINPRYLYQTLADDSFFQYAMKTSKGAKMPRGNKQMIMQYEIPVPPLAEQERIVAILDKFDALVHDISDGLPAEIKANRQRYEYYRNKLLTFKEVQKKTQKETQKASKKEVQNAV